jgi:hypothetical protein
MSKNDMHGQKTNKTPISLQAESPLYQSSTRTDRVRLAARLRQPSNQHGKSSQKSAIFEANFMNRNCEFHPQKTRKYQKQQQTFTIK